MVRWEFASDIIIIGTFPPWWDCLGFCWVAITKTTMTVIISIVILIIIIIVMIIIAVPPTVQPEPSNGEITVR